METFRKVLIGLLVVLVAIQFFHPKRNIATAQSANDIALIYPPGDNVNAILSRACNDCHSNNTRYPWYASFQPVAWWLNDHVQEGKRELNFSEFATYSPRRQYNKLDDVIDLVKKDEMPLGSYTLIHTDARLTKDEKVALTGWADSIRKSMEATYPRDSLIRKK